MHHILLVDDDLNFRRSLVIQLELEGFTVTEIERATQAFTYLEQNQDGGKLPDIVITDVRMPEMGGSEFVMHMKDRYPELPIIVISAFDLPLELTGYPFLRKPFRLQEMIEMIKPLKGQ